MSGRRKVASGWLARAFEAAHKADARDAQHYALLRAYLAGPEENAADKTASMEDVRLYFGF